MAGQHRAEPASAGQRIRITSRHRALCALLTGILCTGTAAGADAPALESFEISYRLKFSILSAEVHISLRGTDRNDEYIFENRRQARGIARLMRPGESVEYSRFIHSAAGPIPIEYDLDDSTDDPNSDSHVDFDWPAGNATSLHDGERRQLTIETGILDRLSADLAAILDLRQGKVLEGYDMVYRNEIRRYEFRFGGEEAIATPAGTFSTLRYLRQRPGSRRSTIIWFAPELCYQPVKVELQREGKTRGTMTIQAYSIAEDCSTGDESA